MRSRVGKHRFTRAVAAAAMIVTAFGVAAPTPASADGVTVDDREPGDEAWFLQIDSVRFANGDKVVRMRAVQPTLHKPYVDLYGFYVGVDKARAPRNRRTFILQWRRGDGLGLYWTRPGMEYPQKKRCRGISMRRVGATDDRPGHVSATIPHRCLVSSGRVRMGYLVADTTASVIDAAPGHETTLYWPGFTGWVRRG